MLRPWISVTPTKRLHTAESEVLLARTMNSSAARPAFQVPVQDCLGFPRLHGRPSDGRTPPAGLARSSKQPGLAPRTRWLRGCRQPWLSPAHRLPLMPPYPPPIRRLLPDRPTAAAPPSRRPQADQGFAIPQGMNLPSLISACSRLPSSGSDASTSSIVSVFTLSWRHHPTCSVSAALHAWSRTLLLC